MYLNSLFLMVDRKERFLLTKYSKLLTLSVSVVIIARKQVSERYSFEWWDFLKNRKLNCSDIAFYTLSSHITRRCTANTEYKLQIKLLIPRA